nr:MAG TPA: hypothetical protein [Caudoviricetes sp.]
MFTISIYTINGETLTAIGDSIRNVDKSLSEMTPTEMAEEIKRLTVKIDSELSNTSTNPLQNKVITEELNNIKQDLENIDTSIYWNDTSV